MNALTKFEAAAVEHTFEQMERMAGVMAKSNMFGMKTPEQALGLMLVAQAEGQHPASITQDYDIIQGKATRKTNSVLARFQAAGGKVEWHELSGTKAEATFTHPQGGSLRLDWTFEMATKAKLTSKDNWQGYPRAMLRARLIAEGVRAVYPAAIGGYLVPEEAMDINDVNKPPSEPKNMGMAEVVEPKAPDTYPADQFEKNLPAWRKVIEAGRKTPAEIIAMAQTKHPLTDAQRAAVMALGNAPDAAPAVTYAQVAEKMHTAQDMDALDDAADLVGSVADEGQRAELLALFDKRRSELVG
jgi:hypothetical protein